jgi:hypothetical protein
MFVFTDSIGALKEAATRPSGRLSAHEMLGQLRDLPGRNLRFSPRPGATLVPERGVEKRAIQRNR